VTGGEGRRRGGPITFKQRCASLHYSNSTAELGSSASTLQGTPFCLSRPCQPCQPFRVSAVSTVPSIFVPLIHATPPSSCPNFFFLQPQPPPLSSCYFATCYWILSVLRRYFCTISRFRFLLGNPSSTSALKFSDFLLLQIFAAIRDSLFT